jgi:hypothetical protein
MMTAGKDGQMTADFMAAGNLTLLLHLIDY